MQLRLVASLNRRRVRNSPDALAADTSDTRAAPACVLLVVGQLREHRLPALRPDGPMALAALIIRWGPDASSDLLRRSARCSRCGRKGATLQHPGWAGSDVGPRPFPTGRLVGVA